MAEITNSLARRGILLFVILISCLSSSADEGFREKIKSCIKNTEVVLFGSNTDTSANWEKKALGEFFESVTFVDCQQKENQSVCRQNKELIIKQNRLEKHRNLADSVWSFNGKVSLFSRMDLEDLIRNCDCQKKLLAQDNMTKEDFQKKQKEILPKVFRNTRWNDTKEEVKESEKATLTQETNNALFYSDVLFGEEVKIVYVFLNNRLARTKYLFQDTFFNSDQYMPLIRNIAKTYFEKYGKPNKFKDVFIENGCPHRSFGDCVAFGYTNMYASWDDKYNTDILLTWGGKNGKSEVSIQYSDIMQEGQEKQKTNEEIMNKI